jgi:ribulose-phosphate 3-epimerase
MPLIVPAILEPNRQSLEDKIFQVTRITGVERVQVDFADGEFVAGKTVSVNEVDPLNPAFQWEAHLMVRAPRNFLDYQIAGFSTIILHYEAFPKEEELDNAAAEIKKLGMKPGVAINPETPVSVLRYFGDTVSNFTLLGVHPGSQGAPFLPQTVERAAELKAALPNAIIEVDGGINFRTIGLFKGLGIDLFVVGSALGAGGDWQKNHDELAALV